MIFFDPDNPSCYEGGKVNVVIFGVFEFDHFLFRVWFGVG